MITWGLMSAGMMFVQGATSFYAMRFLLGVAEAGFLPGIVYYLSQWFPRAAARERRLVVHDRHSAVGRVRRAAVGLLVRLRRVTWACRAGNGCFSSEGLPAVLLGFVVLGFLTDKPADAKWLTPSSADGSRERLHAEHVEAGATISVSVRQVLRASHGVAARDHHVLLPDGSYGLTFWVPSIVKGLAGYQPISRSAFSRRCRTSRRRPAWC